METKPELVIEGNILPEPPKKIKKTTPKILIIEEEEEANIEIEKGETEYHIFQPIFSNFFLNT